MLKEKLAGYNYIGVRTTADDENYSVGDICRKSYEWDYEYDCSTYNTENPIKLTGTCAAQLIIDEDTTEEYINEKINEFSNRYVGEQVIIIGGYEAEYGADEDEIIINEAVVIEVIE